MEINQEAIDKLKETISRFVRSITEAFNNFIKWIHKHWKLIKENWTEFYQYEKEKTIPKKVSYRKEVSVNKMQHQVIDRRPKQMIRKIIH
ncbi:hypothetical protein MKZ20_17615 [Psychrobacillus sp. FSL K6-2684]|uniref:hypothetical protein n=1 Tax=Psychrobacillus sp. FSL K6-2684 TaxID=2921547 RepID=UPI0030F81FB7